LFIKKLKLLAVPVFEIFSIFRPYFRDGYYILFIFLFYDYRVLPGITGYHRVSPGITGYHPTRLPAAP